MILYSASEMIHMLEEDKTRRFERVAEDGLKGTAYIGAFGYININNGNEHSVDGNLRLNDKWKLIPQAVSFDEAIKSGKYFKYESWDKYYPVNDVFRILASKSSSLISKMGKEKKWYIKED